MPVRLKKGDTVLVLSGKDSGKKNKIIRVLREADQFVVEGLNMVKRHKKASQKFQGGIVDMPAPINGSKLALVCPRCSKPTRLKTLRVESGENVRACKKCEEIIDKV